MCANSCSPSMWPNEESEPGDRLCQSKAQDTHHANQMRVCVDGTANLSCTIRKRFACRSPQTEICEFFARTQRELDTPGVFCSPQVRGKLINRAPGANCLVHPWFAGVCQA